MDLGNYQLLKKLATGGMAELFMARQKSVAGFQRNVVVKRILPEFSDDPAFVESFLNEAKLSAQLNHPNVVQIYDLGKVGKSYFIAMEYIKGFDLYALIRLNKKRKTFIPLGVALTIIADVCAGLDYAHNASDVDGNPLGIVHRDVTPSNVLIPMEGNAKVVDFGIAKATARGDGKTKTGTVKGKVAYLAPEQVLGKTLDKRVDVFASGIMFFETVTNRNPFRGDTEFASLQNIVHGEMSTLRADRPDVPEIFEPILAKVLARNPDDRYPSCRAFLIALEAAAQATGLQFSHPQVHAYLTQEQEALVAEAAPSEEEGYLSTVQSQPDIQALEQDRQSSPSNIVSSMRVEEEGSTTFFSRLRRTWAGPVSIAAVAAIFAIAFVVVQTRNEAAALRAKPVTILEDTGIEVLSSPPGADVLLDGALVSGKTPLRITHLEKDRHYAIDVRLIGYGLQKSDVILDRQGMRSLQISLVADAKPVVPPVKTAGHGGGDKGEKHGKSHEVGATPPAPAQAAVQGQGRARFVVQPWAQVTIDGERIGDTPLPPQTLKAGMHTVVLTNPELGKTVTKKIEILPGDEKVVRANLLE